MNKTTKYILYAVGVYAIGYLVWKNWKKNQASNTTTKNPNEPKANAIGGSGIGGVVVPKGKTVELLQSAPGVCGYYYEGDDGDLVFVGAAPCPQAV
jgi:hypothetical protein